MYALCVCRGEKDTKKEADTVGVSTLRVEHISFPEENHIHLSFLGLCVRVSVCVCVNVSTFIHEYLCNRVCMFIFVCM